MVIVIQRVSSAEVQVGTEIIGKIGEGLLILLGIEQGDGDPEVSLLVKKLEALRIFPGRTPMDRSIKDVQGQCLVVSQFTLLGNIHKGNRPSFARAAEPGLAETLYERFVQQLRAEHVPTATGPFAADMRVRLENNGPVTFTIEARAGRLL